MVFCTILMIVCGVLFALDVSFWNTQYITIASTAIFIVAEIVSMNLDQLRCAKMREMERRIRELENKTSF